MKTEQEIKEKITMILDDMEKYKSVMVDEKENLNRSLAVFGDRIKVLNWVLYGTGPYFDRETQK